VESGAPRVEPSWRSRRTSRRYGGGCRRRFRAGRNAAAACLPNSSVLPLTRGIPISACRATSISPIGTFARHRIWRPRGVECFDRGRCGKQAARWRHRGCYCGNRRQRRLAAQRGFRSWSQTAPEARASILERAANLLEERTAHFIALLQREGGKTLDDSLSEVREAIDFCRYYAAEGRKLFGDGKVMPARPARATCCGCAAAACLSRSRHGIFRWRFFQAKSPRR